MENSNETKMIYTSFDLEDVRFTVSKALSLNSANNDCVESALKLHKHYYWEMFFIEENGIVFHDVNGHTFYPKESVLIVPPEYMHYAVNYVATISFVFEKKKNVNSMLYDKLKKFFSLDKVTLVQDKSYQWIWKEIKECLTSNSEFDELRTKHALALVFLKIISFFDKESESDVLRNSNIIYLIDNVISQNYGRKLTLSEIAKEMFLSERQVSRLIKKHYKLTFSEVLRDRRLEIASCLLRDTNKSIDEIREMVGFESQSGFFVSFKKKFGKTPLAFRKSFQNV